MVTVRGSRRQKFRGYVFILAAEGGAADEKNKAKRAQVQGLGLGVRA